MMISLSSEALTITVDAAHGGEMLSLVPSELGEDLLGHPPFIAEQPLGGDLDEDTWTARYRGGWQLAAPNAGAECTVDGAHHGFHGRASVDPWSVVELRPDRVVLVWSGHGVALRRTLTVDGQSVHADLEWTAAGARAAPLVVVEHVTLGSALLDPEVEIEVEANAHELSPSGAQDLQPEDVTRWPEIRLLDGSAEHAGRWSFDAPRGRLTALTGFTSGAARVSNPATGLAVRLKWPSAALPAAWVWHEARHRGGVWNHSAELLGFEPASVPHARGLAAAVEAGEALWAEPGRSDGYRLSLSVDLPSSR